MKKIIFLLLLALSVSQVFSQGNDSTKYTYYRYTYGNRLARYWADTVLVIPNDTIWSKDGLAKKNNTLYIGDGTRWRTISGSGYDSTIMATLFALDTVKSNLRSTLSVKPPADTTIYAPGTGDTTLVLACGALIGSYSTNYYHINVAKYRGFRVHVYYSFQSMLDQAQLCESSIPFGGPFYYTFNSATGDLYVYGTDRQLSNLIQISPY